MKYILIAVFAAVIGVILYVSSYPHVKERVVIPDKKAVKGEPSQLSRIFKCKPLILVIVMGILSSCAGSCSQKFRMRKPTSGWLH